MKYCMQDRHIIFATLNFDSRFIVYDLQKRQEMNTFTLILILKKIMHFDNIQAMENSRTGGLNQLASCSVVVTLFGPPS